MKYPNISFLLTSLVESFVVVFFQPKAMQKKGVSSVFQQKESSSSSKYGKRNDKIFRNSVIRNCFSYSKTIT